MVTSPCSLSEGAPHTPASCCRALLTTALTPMSTLSLLRARRAQIGSLRLETASGRVVSDHRPVVARIFRSAARHRIPREVEEVADGRIVFTVVDAGVVHEVTEEREPAEQLVIDASPRRDTRAGVARVLVRGQRRRQ